MGAIVSRLPKPRMKQEAIPAMSDNEILIVDDDLAVRDSLRALLESSRFAVREFDCAAKLLASPLLPDSGCVVADVRMPDMDGLALQEELIGAKSACR